MGMLSFNSSICSNPYNRVQILDQGFGEKGESPKKGEVEYIVVERQEGEGSGKIRWGRKMENMSKGGHMGEDR